MGCPVCGSSNGMMTVHGDWKCRSCGWKENNMSPEAYRRTVLCPKGGVHNFYYQEGSRKLCCRKCGLRKEVGE